LSRSPHNNEKVAGFSNRNSHSGVSFADSNTEVLHRRGAEFGSSSHSSTNFSTFPVYVTGASDCAGSGTTDPHSSGPNLPNGRLTEGSNADFDVRREHHRTRDSNLHSSGTHSSNSSTFASNLGGLAGKRVQVLKVMIEF
jgi:hypothetical protein